MEFIHAYENWGRKINPRFKDRTIHMLAEHFGYSHGELEDALSAHEIEYVDAGMNEVEAFWDWLLLAIEGDLSIQPKED